MTNSATDSDDWTLAMSGNGEAFGRVFDRHVGRVGRHAARLVSRAADADDVVAIVFFEAWRNRRRVRLVDGSVLPWLLVTTTNVARNLERASRRYRVLLSRLPAPDLHAHLAVEHEDTAAIAAMSRLSRIDREVLALCILEGFSEREAAAAIGVPNGTVKSRLSRAKARLRTELSDLTPTTTPMKEHRNA